MFSLDPTTAYAQGQAQGGSAYYTWTTVFSQNSDTPIVYDLESAGFQYFTQACLTAAQQFISGWTANLHLPPAQHSGLYGSSCGSYIDSFANLGADNPDFVWPAYWDNNPYVYDTPCILGYHWTSDQRLKQYLNQQTPTYGGVSLAVDYDNADGPVYMR